jgi:prevent-host-death family protein
MKVSSTEVQNNFGKYLKIAAEEDVVITRNGKNIARIVACDGDSYVNEEALEYDAGAKTTMSYEEFIALTESSELRYELIDGELYLLASPNFKHQLAVARIAKFFFNWFEEKKCIPLTSPFDVTLFKSKENINVVQPDILVICDIDKVDEKGKYKGVPTLVVEVLSPSTRNKDMIRKLELYRMTGVSEYWMVDVKKKAIHVYQFKEHSITDYQNFINVDTVESQVFTGLKVNLKDVFID